MDTLRAMRAELAMMREEKVRMEARLIATESALEEKKRVLSEWKAMAKSADDLLHVFTEAVGDNLHKNNGQNPDEEITKILIEEDMRGSTEVLNEAQSGGNRPADGGNIGGGHDGNSGDHNLGVVNEALGSDGGKKDGANGGGHRE